MVVYSIVTGGANGMASLKGFEALIKAFAPGAQVVVWVNEFFGPARYKGTDFEQTAIYRERCPRSGALSSAPARPRNVCSEPCRHAGPRHDVRRGRSRTTSC